MATCRSRSSRSRPGIARLARWRSTLRSGSTSSNTRRNGSTPPSTSRRPPCRSTPSPTSSRRCPSTPSTASLRMLADALPDAFGNALVERELTSQGVRKGRHQRAGPPGLPRQPGDRRPRAPPHTWASADEVHRDQARRAGRRRSHRGGWALDGETGISEALRHLIAVGTSAGGARAKAVVAINATTEGDPVRSGPRRPGFRTMDRQARRSRRRSRISGLRWLRTH